MTLHIVVSLTTDPCLAAVFNELGVRLKEYILQYSTYVRENAKVGFP